MGGGAHVVVVGGRHAALVEQACRRLDDLEARWSRFRADSEVMMLNGMPDIPVVVSSETFELISKAVFGWRETRGRFDPTVLEAVVSSGYDRSFELIGGGGQHGPLRSVASPGCHRIDLNGESLAVKLPRGVMVDPGGIGKGLAGDIVVRELLAAGADGAMVNLGGDVRAAGRPPEGDGWTILVEDPFDAAKELSRIRLTDGAVVTSSRLSRRWRFGDTDAHHLIDSRTGRPFQNDVAAVTVVAGEGWWAEVMTKSVFTVEAERAADVLINASALVVDVYGGQHASPGFWEVAA